MWNSLPLDISPAPYLLIFINFHRHLTLVQTETFSWSFIMLLCFYMIICDFIAIYVVILSFCEVLCSLGLERCYMKNYLCFAVFLLQVLIQVIQVLIENSNLFFLHWSWWSTGFIGTTSIRSKPFILADISLDSRKQSDCVSVITSHLSDCLHTIKYHTNI